VVLVVDLTDCLYLQLILLDGDVARFQRAGKGAGQSAAGGGHDVVKSRGVRWILIRLDAIVHGHLGVNAEGHRLLLGGQVGQPLRATQALDAHA